jgi:hypothetical protein
VQDEALERELPHVRLLELQRRRAARQAGLARVQQPEPPSMLGQEQPARHRSVRQAVELAALS